MRGPIKIIVLGLFLYLCPPWLWGDGSAFAQQSAALSYTLPTTYSNGAALPVTAIAGFDAQCSSFTPTNGTAGACTIAGGSVTGAVTSIVLTGTISPTGGSACFQVRTRATNGEVSTWTAPKCKTFAAVPPSEPGNVTVAVVIGVNTSPVFGVLADGSRSQAVAGFIAPDQKCGPIVRFTYRGKPYRDVDPNDVRWWNTARTTRVAGPCNG